MSMATKSQASLVALPVRSAKTERGSWFRGLPSSFAQNITVPPFAASK